MKLYHYTKLTNIEKIVKPDKVDLMMTYYSKYKESDYLWIRERGKRLVKELCEEYKYEFDPDYLAHAPYIISFCKSSDSDYMWNTFGDGGEGVVLIISEERLSQETSLIDNCSMIVPCMYVSPKSDDDIIKKTIKKISSSTYLNNCPDDDRLMFSIMGVLQNKYSDELEIRYVQIEKTVFMFNCIGNSLQIKDYEVPKEKWNKIVSFPNNIIEGIILGRNTDQDDLEYCRNYMAGCGYNPNSVIRIQEFNNNQDPSHGV